MDSTLLSKLLEDSIVASVRCVMGKIRLSPQWSDEAWGQQVSEAKRSLDLLSEGGTPCYRDPIVALLYFLRYHYAHANMAWSAIAAVLPPEDTGEVDRRASALQVVDFGAGTSAMYTGLVFYLAELIELGHKVGPVTVQSIEPSAAMRELASAFDLRFKSAVKRMQRHKATELRALARALDLADHSIHADRSMIEKSGKNRWLSALHTVYEDAPKGKKLKSSLARLNWALAPTEGVMTFNEAKWKEAPTITPFKGRHCAPPLVARLPEHRLIELDRVCRDISFVRHSDNPWATQVYATPKNAVVRHWTDLPPANILGNPV